jgi:hypothetical protein
LVEGLRRQTASMTDEELVRTLVKGLEGRSGSPPAARLGVVRAPQDPHDLGVDGGKARIRTCDLRVMSPTSYQAAPLRAVGKRVTEPRAAPCNSSLASPSVPRPPVHTCSLRPALDEVYILLLAFRNARRVLSQETRFSALR